MRSSIAAALIVALITLPACSGEPVAGLQVDNARIRELIPGQDKTAGFFDVRNTTSEPVVIMRAESAAARAIEFHTTRLDAGVMRMRRLTEVRIEAGGMVQFQPGGHHLMLFGVRSLEDPTEIRLITGDGEALSVPFRRVAIGE